MVLSEDFWLLLAVGAIGWLLIEWSVYSRGYKMSWWVRLTVAPILIITFFGSLAAGVCFYLYKRSQYTG